MRETSLFGKWVITWEACQRPQGHTRWRPLNWQHKICVHVTITSSPLSSPSSSSPQSAFTEQLSSLSSSLEQHSTTNSQLSCHHISIVVIVINTTISINILEYIFRRWVGREKGKRSPRKRAEVYDGWEWVWGRLPRWLRFRSAVDNTLQCMLQCIYNVYVSYKVCSVCLDLRLTSKGGAGCFLSPPAAADDPPTCICIHPGGTHVNTITSWWTAYMTPQIHAAEILHEDIYEEVTN